MGRTYGTSNLVRGKMKIEYPLHTCKTCGYPVGYIGRVRKFFGVSDHVCLDVIYSINTRGRFASIDIEINGVQYILDGALTINWLASSSKEKGNFLADNIYGILFNGDGK